MWKYALVLFMALNCLKIATADPDPVLSIDFNQVPVHSLLINLARFSDKNMVVDPAISGEMTLHLQQVPWSTIIQFIVDSQHLSLHQLGSIVYITPASPDDEVQAKLQQVVVPLAYSKASEMMTLIQNPASSLLSKKGTVIADNHTNSLWLEETPAHLQRLQGFIHLLDKPPAQIRLEARIITLDIRHERDLGLQFALSQSPDVSGSLSTANHGAVALNFHLPATINSGLATINLGHHYYLDLELSALEAQGIGKVMASPSLMVANQQTATIDAGQDIPYQEKAYGGGTNVAFKKAALSLQVTPHILPKQQILLDLHINQDRVSTLEVNGVPTIDTREIHTQILAKNLQTIVLGGIYETDKQQRTERIPFLADIPWVGALFTHQYEANQKRELLIFVTPILV